MKLTTVFFTVLFLFLSYAKLFGMSCHLSSLFLKCISLKASDVHLSASSKPWLRIDGDLRQLEEEPLFSDQDLENMLFVIMPDGAKEVFAKNFSVDFAYPINSEYRLRANVFRCSKGIAAVFRFISNSILSIEQLNLPRILETFALLKSGLLLVTGPTGSGKSTTLASLVDYINHNRACHIITIEDPIEFVYQSQKSLISQRQIGKDAVSFSEALKNALREDPDILLVGELRDLETIRLALTAAETGHLVLATLHTISAAQTITRIVDVFPGSEQPLVRVMLAETLRAVVSQVLCKKKEGGRIAATEILVVNPAISNLIRENKTMQIYSQMQMGSQHGMHTLEQSRKKIMNYE
ncbi:MAG: type IV pilus twitching motility protein PilT [Gammaproteobacteria bacterium]